MNNKDDIQPCGHHKGQIVTSNEGTSYCKACEREARKKEKKQKNDIKDKE